MSPLFFPGGDIGSLAVHGTVNDLAMRGAGRSRWRSRSSSRRACTRRTPRRLTASWRGGPRRRGRRSSPGTPRSSDAGAADKIFINTTGVGRVLSAPRLRRARPTRRRVLLSGPIGLHGTTVLSAREGLGFEADIASDSQPLHRLVRAHGPASAAEVHTLRDPTRADWPRR